MAHSQLIVYNYFNLNYNDYSEFIKKTSKIPVTVDIRFLTSPSLLLQANKLIFNLLSSFKFFIDNTRAFLTRKYRDNPEIISKYESLIYDHYNQHFYYRFLTKLRDYAVHVGFPLQGLTFSAEKNELNPEKMIGKIQLLIDLELMKYEKSTFKKVHKELLELEDDIDLNPLINNLIKSVDQIQNYVYTIQKSEIEESIENIETFVGNHKNKNNDIYMFSNLIEKQNEVEWNAYKIPFEMISDFKNYKNWC